MKLGVNVDHVATLRQARRTRYPDPVELALAAERAGADSVTLHLREDRRHIQDRDVELLRQLLQTRMNLEMALTDEMIEFALRILPEDCCLVPERREELTTEGGLDVVTNRKKLAAACKRLMEAGIHVSLFIDADTTQIEAAADTGAKFVELHTGHYANSADPADDLGRLELSTQSALKLGMEVNAGHGLNYQNVQAVAAIPGISGLNIGHAIIAEALYSGMPEAVRRMKKLITEARSQP